MAGQGHFTSVVAGEVVTTVATGPNLPREKASCRCGLRPEGECPFCGSQGRVRAPALSGASVER